MTLRLLRRATPRRLDVAALTENAKGAGRPAPFSFLGVPHPLAAMSVRPRAPTPDPPPRVFGIHTSCADLFLNTLRVPGPDPGIDPRIHAAPPARTWAGQRPASRRGWPGRRPAKVVSAIFFDPSALCESRSPRGEGRGGGRPCAALIPGAVDSDSLLSSSAKAEDPRLCCVRRQRRGWSAFADHDERCGWIGQSLRHLVLSEFRRRDRDLP
jgi:hypothetical protein